MLECYIYSILAATIGAVIFAIIYSILYQFYNTNKKELQEKKDKVNFLYSEYLNDKTDFYSYSFYQPISEILLLFLIRKNSYNLANPKDPMDFAELLLSLNEYECSKDFKINNINKNNFNQKILKIQSFYKDLECKKRKFQILLTAFDKLQFKIVQNENSDYTLKLNQICIKDVIYSADKTSKDYSQVLSMILNENNDHEIFIYYDPEIPIEDVLDDKTKDLYGSKIELVKEVQHG